MRFVQREAFDQREILTYIAGASDVAKGLGRVAERVSSLGNEIRCVGIEERGAVEEVIRSIRRERPVRLWSAAAAARERVIRRSVRSEQGLARNKI